MPGLARSRIRIGRPEVGFKSSFTVDGVPVSYNFPQFLVPSDKHEFIHDTVGSRGTVNPVEHVSLVSSLSIPPLTFRDSNNQLIQILYEPVKFDLVKAYKEWGMIPDPSVTHAQQWAYEAYTAFSQQIPQKLLLANFLYELKDIKSLLPKIEKSITRTASSNFLAYQFGIAPTVGDIKALFAMTEQITKRLKHLRDSAGKQVDLSFTRTIPAMVSNPDISVPFGGSFEGPSYVVRRLSYQGKFRIFGKLVQNLDIPDTSLTTAKAFAAAAGFNNPAAIVWEAIPYSFVIDWFFHVGSLIDTLNIQPFGGDWTVSKVGYSIKDEFLYAVYLDLGANASHQMVYCGTVTVQRFVRKPGFPMSSLLLTDGSLSPTQQVLALALLEQRR